MRSDNLPIVWIRQVHCAAVVAAVVAALLLSLLPQVVAAAQIGTLEQTSGGLEPAAPTTSQPTGTAADWTGNYYATQDLSGDPVLTRQDGAIDFDWQAGSPDTSVSSDSFSVSWTATSTFEAASYRFTARADDGVRIYVDDTLLLEDWNVHPATTTVSDAELTEGSHTIRVEYFEAVGMASITVGWQKLEEETPDCEIQPHESLSSFWDHSSLGCASAPAQTVWSAWQPFESGHMIWRQDSDDLFVYANDGNWSQFNDNWDDQALTNNRGTPPTGLQSPVRGFGYLWETNDDVYCRPGLGRGRGKGILRSDPTV